MNAQHHAPRPYHGQMFQKTLIGYEPYTCAMSLEGTSGTSVGAAAERAPVGGHGKPESQRLVLDTDQVHVRREPRSKLAWLFQKRKKLEQTTR